MQLHLADRYHLPPSLIYALARKATGSDHIDIDVDADFVVIGVLAWKGETRVSNPNAREEAKERKNLRFTLVDLSTPAASQSGAGTLSVMLFEAQSVDQGVGEDGWEAPRYKGGSGGAYEKFWKESAGAVVAIINPQILKPRVVSSRVLHSEGSFEARGPLADSHYSHSRARRPPASPMSTLSRRGRPTR